MAIERVILVGNPTAQSGKNEERIREALSILEGVGVRAELFATLPEGRTVAALSTLLASSEVDAVIAMGGDGTFREVGAALLASSRAKAIAMGMLPTGTANDQGRSFGLSAAPSALADNVRVIVAGKETLLDAGHLIDTERGTEHVFFDSAGWGMSAHVLSERNRDRALVEKLGPLKEIYRDKLVYAGALARVLLEEVVSGSEFDAEVRIDGVPHVLTGLTDLVLKATRVYAGAWVLDRTSHHDDGAFELVPFRGKLDWTSKAIVDLEGNPLTEEVLNAVGIEHSKPIRGSSFSLKFPHPVYLQIDGEEMPPSLAVEVTISPRAIRLIVPEAEASKA